MLNVIAELRERAKKKKARIVLPEGENPKVIRAADYIYREKLVEAVLLGNRKKIDLSARYEGLDVSGVEVIDPSSSKYLSDFASRLFRLTKHKDMTPERAKKTLLEKTVYFGSLLVKIGEADGFVAGAVHTTRDVARAAMYCIGIDHNIGTMSSSFIIAQKDESMGARGVMIFADCAIVPRPSAKQLANIAVSASDLMRTLFSETPRVAVLSYSTKGSGSSPETQKLLEAVDNVKRTRPELLIDGEMQADAALIQDVAGIKAPNSPVAGRANVLIFPNLASGNISYKLVQRLAGARAVGPLLQGLQAPCSDLSRGCSVDDIIDAVCLTAIRCPGNK